MITDDVASMVSQGIADTENTARLFQQRLTQGRFSRDENPHSHFCVYFLPYNPVQQRVFLALYKTSNLWLSPGGHLDAGEAPGQTLRREIKEELDMTTTVEQTPSPFLLTITSIQDPARQCKEHFDIWYLLETDGSHFVVDPREFHDTRWMTFAEARSLVTDQPTLTALSIIEKWYANTPNA